MSLQKVSEQLPPTLQLSICHQAPGATPQPVQPPHRAQPPVLPCQKKRKEDALQILSPYSFTLPHLQVRRALGAAIPCSSCARCWLSPYGISNVPSTYHQRSTARSHYGLHSSTCDPFPPFQDKNPAQRQRRVWAQQNWLLSPSLSLQGAESQSVSIPCCKLPLFQGARRVLLWGQ